MPVSIFSLTLFNDPVDQITLCQFEREEITLVEFTWVVKTWYTLNRVGNLLIVVPKLRCHLCGQEGRSMVHNIRKIRDFVMV